MWEEDDEDDGEELRRYRKAGNEEREWRLRMEKKMDEMENIGRFMMTNLGSLLRAMEGLKKEVADLGEWIREEMKTGGNHFNDKIQAVACSTSCIMPSALMRYRLLITFSEIIINHSPLDISLQFHKNARDDFHIYP